MHNITSKLLAKPENVEIMSLLERHDIISYQHCLSVANTVEVLSPAFEFKGIKNKEEIIEGALLHDIGKVLVSPEILNKQGKLTPLEFTIVKEHPRCGTILAYERSEIIRNIIMFHHERLDGSGYPYGLKGEHIPDYCRFITTIDILDALLSKRSYKEPYPLPYIYGEIKDMYNGQNLDMYYFSKILNFFKYGSFDDKYNKEEFFYAGNNRDRCCHKG